VQAISPAHLHLPLLYDKILIQGEAVHGWNKKRPPSLRKSGQSFTLLTAKTYFVLRAILYHIYAKQQAR
jgi:hypothetical protein